MCNDDTSMYLKVFPYTHSEGIYIVGRGVGRTQVICRAVFPSIRLVYRSSLILSLRIVPIFANPQTQELGQRHLYACQNHLEIF